MFGSRPPPVSVRLVSAWSRGAARVWVGLFRPIDGAMELGTGYEWCDADDITEKQQAGQLAGPENGGWDFSVFGIREQSNPPWDWKERTFYELVRSGGNTGALRCKLCNKFLQVGPSLRVETRKKQITSPRTDSPNYFMDNF